MFSRKAKPKIEQPTWVQPNSFGPRFYVTADCASHGSVQSFSEYRNSGISVGFQAFANHQEIGRFVEEGMAKACVENNYTKSFSKKDESE